MFKRIIFVIMVAVTLSGCGLETDQNGDADTPDEPSVEASSEDATSGDQEDKGDKAEAEDENASEASSDSNDESETSDSKSSLPSSELNVHYIDVGQADATLFQYADDDGEHVILFDTGDWNRNDTINYLKAQGISSIDLVVTSHPHADHIGQLGEIMETFDIEEVWMSGNESTSKTFQHAIEAVLSSDASFHEPRTGEEFAIGSMDIDVLYPSSISGDFNDESVSLLFTYGEVSFLFTGDAEQQAEKQMVQSGRNIEADILQLGHHGSKTSSTQAFIDAVAPSVAIYSAGANNSYGHPDAEVISRIQDAGIDLYGTDVHGTIIVTTDGKEYNVRTNKDGTISPKSTGSANTGKTSNNKKTDSSESKAPSGDCVNINDASVETLQQIKHIGPARAEDVIAMRPFDSIDDLTRVNGIGPARIADIKEEGIACVN